MDDFQPAPDVLTGTSARQSRRGYARLRRYAPGGDLARLRHIAVVQPWHRRVLIDGHYEALYTIGVDLGRADPRRPGHVDGDLVAWLPLGLPACAPDDQGVTPRYIKVFPFFNISRHHAAEAVLLPEPNPRIAAAISAIDHWFAHEKQSARDPGNPLPAWTLRDALRQWDECGLVPASKLPSGCIPHLSQSFTRGERTRLRAGLFVS